MGETTEKGILLSEEQLTQIRNIHSIQGNDGNWNHNRYLHGMYNGMELMMAIIEGRSPQCRDAPRLYGEEKCSLPTVLTATWQEIQGRAKRTRMENAVVDCVKYLVGCDEYIGRSEEDIYEMLRTDAVELFDTITGRKGREIHG